MGGEWGRAIGGRGEGQKTPQASIEAAARRAPAAAPRPAHLAAERGRRLLAAALPGAVGAVYVVEPPDAALEPKVLLGGQAVGGGSVRRAGWGRLGAVGGGCGRLGVVGGNPPWQPKPSAGPTPTTSTSGFVVHSPPQPHPHPKPPTLPGTHPPKLGAPKLGPPNPPPPKPHQPCCSAWPAPLSPASPGRTRPGAAPATRRSPSARRPRSVCLFVCVFVWLVGCLVGWLVVWLVGWLVVWLFADHGGTGLPWRGGGPQTRKQAPGQSAVKARSRRGQGAPACRAACTRGRYRRTRRRTGCGRRLGWVGSGWVRSGGLCFGVLDLRPPPRPPNRPSIARAERPLPGDPPLHAGLAARPGTKQTSKKATHRCTPAWRQASRKL